MTTLGSLNAVPSHNSLRDREGVVASQIQNLEPLSKPREPAVDTSGQDREEAVLLGPAIVAELTNFAALLPEYFASCERLSALRDRAQPLQRLLPAALLDALFPNWCECLPGPVESRLAAIEKTGIPLSPEADALLIPLRREITEWRREQSRPAPPPTKQRHGGTTPIVMGFDEHGGLAASKMDEAEVRASFR